jgi:predicted ATPase
MHGDALLLLGEPGIGKSSLVAAASARARANGFQVLIATGVQSEAQLPFAGLHQLTRALQGGVDSLPGPHREALQAAFGRSTSAAPDLFLIALAALDLLADAATHSPVLVIAEDAQWLDRPTCDVLSFVARRLESDPIILLIALRAGIESALLSAGLRELCLDPLPEPDAAALLDARAPGLTPAVRRRVPDEARGRLRLATSRLRPRRALRT